MFSWYGKKSPPIISDISTENRVYLCSMSQNWWPYPIESMYIWYIYVYLPTYWSHKEVNQIHVGKYYISCMGNFTYICLFLTEKIYGFHVNVGTYTPFVPPSPWEMTVPWHQVGVATKSGTQFVVSILGAGSQGESGEKPWRFFHGEDGTVVYIYLHENHTFYR